MDLSVVRELFSHYLGSSLAPPSIQQEWGRSLKAACSRYSQKHSVRGGRTLTLTSAPTPRTKVWPHLNTGTMRVDLAGFCQRYIENDPLANFVFIALYKSSDPALGASRCPDTLTQTNLASTFRSVRENMRNRRSSMSESVSISLCFMSSD